MERGQDVPADVLARAVECVLTGGILLYPTETVYGLGSDAANGEATRSIRRLKRSDPQKPLLVLTDSWERVEGWIRAPRGLTLDLMQIAESHPLTILFPAEPTVPESLIGASEAIGFRLTHDRFCRQLIQEAATPLSSTSANRTGEGAPSRLEQVEPSIRAGADFAVDGGTLPGVASTIVRATSEGLEVLREGSLSAADLAQLLS